VRLRDFVGNQRLVEILRRGRLPGASLFTGPEGVGKKTLALSLSALANCKEGSEDELCGTCSSCVKEAAGHHPDIRLFQPHKNLIKIDTMRELNREVRFRPFEGRLRCFIIDQAETLTEEAANCILKTLEEPPDTSRIILISSFPHRLLPNLVTGEIKSHAGDAVILATGGYSNVFFLSTNAMGCNVTAAFRACKKGAGFANPCYTQIHPTCIPQAGDYQSKLTLMSESLRNDGRIWVPIDKDEGRSPEQIPDDARDYYLERKYPSFGNLAPRDIASRSAKEVCDAGHGIGATGMGVYLDFREAISRLGPSVIKERYGNLFEMYQRITNENPYNVPMRIFPAPHYTMGGLWVDYNLMSTIDGLHVLGEANFSDHGANRLGASALMQGLADGYFVIPSTIAHYIASQKLDKITTDDPEFKRCEEAVQAKTNKLLSIKGHRSVDSFHKQLGRIMWNHCGMARSKQGLNQALQEIPALRQEFWESVNILGVNEEYNVSLEKAGRVADFLEFAEMMCLDALEREESCGGHFRIEHQTEDGEALRHDADFSHASVWEYAGEDQRPTMHKENLEFTNVQLAVRSYK